MWDVLLRIVFIGGFLFAIYALFILFTYWLAVNDKNWFAKIIIKVISAIMLVIIFIFLDILIPIFMLISPRWLKNRWLKSEIFQQYCLSDFSDKFLGYNENNFSANFTTFADDGKFKVNEIPFSIEYIGGNINLYNEDKKLLDSVPYSWKDIRGWYRKKNWSFRPYVQLHSTVLDYIHQ